MKSIPAPPSRLPLAKGFFLLFVLLSLGGGLSAQVVVDSAAALRTAVQSASPGDTIIVRNGIYNNTVWTIIGEGTEAAPITIRAETPGRVVSTGRSNMSISGRHMIIKGFVFTEGGLANGHVIQFRTSTSQLAHHVRLTQCAIINYNVPGTRTFYVSIYGTHNRVDHNYFGEHNQNGVTAVVWLPASVPAGQDEGVYHRIDNNHFADRIDGGENGWETIRIGDSNTSMRNARVTVEENLFSRVNGEIEIISNKSCENIYRNNTFFHSQGTLTLRHGDRCIVDGNYFLGGLVERTGGIRVIGEDHVVINNYIAGTTGRDGAAITVYAGVPDSPLNEYFAAHNALIAFNTFYLVERPFLSLATGFGTRGRTVLPENVIFANNVMIAGALTSDTVVTGEEVPSHFFEGNFFQARALGRSSPEGFTEANLFGTHAFANGILRPRANSPVIGAAVGDYPMVAEDIDGQPRTLPKTAGFDQPSTAPVTRRSWLQPADVGPDWLDEERSLRFLQQLRAGLSLFNDGSIASDDGWVDINQLGPLFIDLYPWVHHAGLDTWVYTQGTGMEGFWSHEATLGWIYLKAELYPFIYSSESGWLYFFGETMPRRLFWDFSLDAVVEG